VNVAALGGLADEGPHEQRLADARLTGHEDDLPLPRPGSRERVLKLRELLFAVHEDGVARFRRGGRDGRRGDEPVAAAVQCLDVAWAPRVVPQRLADLLDAGHQRGVADRRVRPDRGEQLILGDDPSGALGQTAQESQRFRREPDGPRACRESAAIEAVRAERNGLILHRFPLPAW